MFVLYSQLIKNIGDEDLMELALPRLSKAITVWEFLLMKVEEAHSQKLPFQEILQHFESVRKHVRLFADECLERVSAKCDKHGDAGVQLENKTPERQEAASTSKSSDPSKDDSDAASTSNSNDPSKRINEPCKSDKVPADNDTERDKEQRPTNDSNMETEKSGEQNKEENKPHANDSDKTSEIQAQASSDERVTDTELTTSEESKVKVTENGDATEKGSELAQSSGNEVEKSSSRTDDNDEVNSSASVKETDAKEGKENDSKVSENSNNISQSTESDTARSKPSKPEGEISKDFLELDEEVAKALGMEVGRYSIRDWTSTKLPAMYRFSKAVTEEEDSPSDEEPEESEPVAKRQRVEESPATSPQTGKPVCIQSH